MRLWQEAVTLLCREHTDAEEQGRCDDCGGNPAGGN